MRSALSRSPARSPASVRAAFDSVFLHDMKNLEFRLGLLLSNLQEHYGDPEFQRSAVELLESTVGRVDSVIQSWMAHQEAVLIKVSLDLADLLREVARRARAREADGILRNSARCRVDLDLSPTPRIWGDPFFLENVFLSLVQNGMEAAGPSGVVRIRTLARHGRPPVRIEIEDNGPGIPPGLLRGRLFRPFQTTKPGGVGLGLYTARRIVELHRGRLTARNRPGGGGAVLTVTIPASQTIRP